MDVILTLKAKTLLAGNVWSFKFALQKPFSWAAGQFIKVNLPHARPDAGGSSRRFTIAAAPHEHDISITTRITDTTFKRALSAIPLGGSLNLVDTPAGDFTWRSSPHTLIFVAHGIGITPFYAIIKDRIHRNVPVNAHLIYVNQLHSPILFESDLATWAGIDPSLTITIQREPATPAMLANTFPNLANHFVYVSGPKPLVALCMPPYNLPLAHLKQDNFPGYPASAY
jgi:ferredoxin-NADP reductase